MTDIPLFLMFDQIPFLYRLFQPVFDIKGKMDLPPRIVICRTGPDDPGGAVPDPFQLGMIQVITFFKRRIFFDLADICFIKQTGAGTETRIITA